MLDSPSLAGPFFAKNFAERMRVTSVEGLVQTFLLFVIVFSVKIVAWDNGLK